MKSKTTQTQSNTYGYQTPPTTSQQTEFDNHVRSAYDTPDPTIPYTFGNMRKNVDNRLNDPFGFNYSPEVSEAIKYNEHNQIDQAQGNALREDAFNRKNAKTQGLAMSAAGHAPQLTNPGFGGILMGGLSAGAQLGSAAMT